APALVLEAVDGPLQRPLVGGRRPRPGQRAELVPAAAAAAGELQLAPAAPAERLLQPADSRPAPGAEPGAERATAPAARRQQPVEPSYTPSAYRPRQRPLLTQCRCFRHGRAPGR